MYSRNSDSVLPASAGGTATDDVARGVKRAPAVAVPCWIRRFPDAAKSYVLASTPSGERQEQYRRRTEAYRKSPCLGAGLSGLSTVRVEIVVSEVVLAGTSVEPTREGQ